MKDLKKFILAFVFLVIVQPLSIPLSFFPEFLKRIYLACEPAVLAYAQINRGYMGYLSAISSNIAFAFSLHYKKAIFIFWWFLMAILAFLTGTKGVMIALVAGMFIILFFYKKEALKRITIMFAFLFFLMALFGASIIPCGTVKKYQDIKHSVITRLNEMSRVNEMRKADLHSYLLGRGFGASTQKFEGGKLVPSSSSLNLFLDILADTGIIGLVLFLSSVFILMMAMFRALKINAADDARIMIAVFFIILIILIVKLNISTSTYDEDLLALLIGVMIGFTKTAAAEKRNLNIKVVKEI
jgi:O-antigen ligase